MPVRYNALRRPTAHWRIECCVLTHHAQRRDGHPLLVSRPRALWALNVYRLHLNREARPRRSLHSLRPWALSNTSDTDFPHNAANGRRPSAVSHRQLSASRSNRRNRNFHRNIVFSSTASRTMISDGRTPSLKSGPFLVEEEFQRARKPARIVLPSTRTRSVVRTVCMDRRFQPASSAICEHTAARRVTVRPAGVPCAACTVCVDVPATHQMSAYQLSMVVSATTMVVRERGIRVRFRRSLRQPTTSRKQANYPRHGVVTKNNDTGTLTGPRNRNSTLKREQLESLVPAAADNWGHYCDVRGEILGSSQDINSICQRCFHQSRTKVRGSKAIRYRPSSNRKYMSSDPPTLTQRLGGQLPGPKILDSGEYGCKAET
ncbi:hypothetical protein EVAR_89982_1 [Eumeta japonica]|uniref:Uncharacterized protein n=1 Tax=Eumeta variegata TaxID=151549 RepID=A0A4C2ADC0_EUMVA|nr:hypothetical protein EVAR_89982_1 [Eumeta japonica]